MNWIRRIKELRDLGLPIQGAAKTLELHFGGSRIDQEANFKAGSTQVVQGLRDVFIFQHGNRFQFNKHLFFHQQVCKIVTDYNAIIKDLDRNLLSDFEAGFMEIVS